MLITLARFTIIAFGAFFIVAGWLMLFHPQRARSILRKAGSTTFINYAELSIRMLPGLAFIIYAESSAFTIYFQVIGWFIVTTSTILMLIPKHVHHRFSNSAADILKPLYFQLISPLSMLIGVLIVYAVR